MATHEIQYKFDNTDYDDNSNHEYSETRKKVEKRFPKLGFYNLALDVTENIGTSDVVTGDAIDDITDIVKDLLDVQWRFENTSDNDALFNFEFSFRTHWGRHLRILQFYVHDLYW